MSILDLKVSVIVPAHNSGRFIAETIMSVLNQTHKNFEIIIVDDCSTDDTIEIIKSFEDERILLLENESNSGAAYSRNKAIANAKGDFIAFLDADDKWLPDKLEKQILFMESNHYDFSYTGYSWVREDNSEIGVFVSGPTKVTHKMFLRSNYVGCSTVMFRRSIYPDLNVPDSIKKRNDYALWLLLSKKADCYYLDECLTKYRKISGSISSGSKAKLVKHHYQVFKEVCGFKPIKAYLFAILNIVYFLFRSKKYKKTKSIKENNSLKIENSFFIFVVLCSSLFFYLFGNSINKAKIETTYLNASNFVRKDATVHLKVSAKDGLGFDESEKLMKELYGGRGKYNPYYIFDDNIEFEYESIHMDVDLCASPVYSDYEYTEYLGLPLYKNDFSIKKGPQNGADFASYIPSSLADHLLTKLHLTNYDELLNKNIVYRINTSSDECTMSINNIYLNNNTVHWNDNDITIDFYKTFANHVPNGIFSYCPRYFRKINKGALCFEVNSSTEHFKLITNKTLEFNENESIELTYTMTRSDNKTFEYKLAKKDLVTDFGDFNHIILYVGFGVMFINILVLMLTKHFRQKMMKPVLISGIGLLVFMLIGELFKNIFVWLSWPYIVFNYVGNGMTLVFLLYLFLLAWLFAEEKEND